VDPFSVWAAAVGDPREGPEGKGEDVGESREATLAKATAHRWTAATTPPARGTVSSMTPLATQANRFAYLVLQRPRWPMSIPKYLPLI
jgi:hypothetical protein